MADELNPKATGSETGRRVVALTGAVGLLGAGLIRLLELDERYGRVLAIDIQQPPGPLQKTRFHKVDLTLPGADSTMADLLQEAEVDTFVHLAFLSNFTHRSSWAHELESIGTLHVLNACSDSPVRKVVLWSQGHCYGANPDNPAYLKEDRPLVGASGPNDSFFADKIDAEHQARQFAQERPGVTLSVLRLAPVLMPGGANFISRLLSTRLVPVLMGYDPLLQFLHRDDAVRALKLVVDRDHPGIYNIAADGVLPLRTITGILGRVPVPVPLTIARQILAALWMGQVIDVPPSFWDFLRYPCVLDTGKARAELRFIPRYDIHEILAEMAGGPAAVAPSTTAEATAAEAG